MKKPANIYKEYKIGLTLTEMMIAISVLGIMSLSLAEFSQNMFQVSYDHSIQVEKAKEMRLSSDLLANELHKAAYIFPAGQEIDLTNDSETVSVDTNNAVIYFVETDDWISTPTYTLRAFYLKEQNDGKYSLYYFSGESENDWPTNTVPLDNSLATSGSSDVIASDIIYDDSELEYILSSNNGISDTILKGSLANADIDDTNALIKGINWKLVIDKKQIQEITIGGMSNNAPRFVD